MKKILAAVLGREVDAIVNYAAIDDPNKPNEEIYEVSVKERDSIIITHVSLTEIFEAIGERLF